MLFAPIESVANTENVKPFIALVKLIFKKYNPFCNPSVSVNAGAVAMLLIAMTSNVSPGSVTFMT